MLKDFMGEYSTNPLFLENMQDFIQKEDGVLMV